MSVAKHSSLRKELELFTIAVVVVTIAILMTIFYFNHAQSQKQLQQALSTKMASVSDMMVTSAQEKMEKAIFSFTRDSILLDGVRDNDLDAIASRANTTANLLEATGIISNIRVLSPQGQVLFTRNAEETGKKLSSRLVEQAATELNLVRGLEKIGSAPLQVHFVLPIAPKGQLLAVVDMALDYQSLVGPSARVSGTPLALFDRAGQPLTASDKSLLAQIEQSGFKVTGQALGQVETDQSAFTLSSLPLTTAQGKTVAYLVAADDTTDLTAAQNLAFYGGLAAVILWALVAFLAIKWILVRAFKPLEAMQQTVAIIQQKGDLSTRVPVENQNEVGQAAEAINRMLDTLDSVFSDSNRVMQAVSEGDFSQSIHTERFAGDFARLTQNINASTQSLSFTMSELEKVVIGLEKGDLGLRMDAQVKGEIRLHVDTAMQSMQKVIADIVMVLEHMAQGDFTRQVTVEAQGDFKQLAGHVNNRVKQTHDALEDIAKVVEAMSNGDLTQRVQGDYAGKFGEVSDLLDRSAQNLSELLARTRSTAQTLISNVGQIYQGARDLNDRTQRQAASLEQTTSMMQKITDAVTQTTEHAQSANQQSTSARNQAENGAEVMRATVHSMGDIREASHKIEEIITLIDSIAFQTNLLALNAAVEAARAGEHGRGFAVVAGEVRSLAGKSADAAKDIKALIENAVAAVDEGTQKAEASDKALQGITDVIRQVSDSVAEISAASDEQTRSIQQISQAVSEIDEVTQQNAALVEQTSAASESMKEEAEALQEQVSHFKT
ncbi:MAG: methyl-accepting chemotaxis protein [Hydrogenovibrio sp.]|uniref:methyl-accepting chemotaxis protein n=1 Tax=Hydrogenovibrio sp. TaxID=2065821 RepID=UPI002870573C|nr:methyl-accepting chemotaxis protein [Hydrogenovibrio sp.]MDR9498061.1 methyl-accepting chemotaxis protein [Hydrogenovibrio sp.]